MMNAPRLLSLVSISLSISGAIGCGGSLISPSRSTPASCQTLTPFAGSALSGKVLAASQPVSGASVELYAAGNTGNGSTSTALLSAHLSTAANGSFSIPAGYTCPSSQTPVYLLSKGGQSGSG